MPNPKPATESVDRYFIGIDLASSRDKSAVTIAEMRNGTMHVIGNASSSDVTVAAIRALRQIPWWKRWLVRLRLKPTLQRLFGELKP